MINNPQINEYGDKSWHNSQGKLHRDDGTAIECVNGTKWWYINGLRHREDGPAVILENGYVLWYIEGNLIL